MILQFIPGKVNMSLFEICNINILKYANEHTDYLKKGLRTLPHQCKANLSSQCSASTYSLTG